MFWSKACCNELWHLMDPFPIFQRVFSETDSFEK